LYSEVVKGETYLLGSLWKKNVEEGELCDDLTGRHLGQGGLTNPPQKEQCRKDSVYCLNVLG